MTPDAAAWVRAEVWQDHHRATIAEIPTFYGMCACQYGHCGHCGHCAAGRHHACTHDHHPSAEHPAGYLTNRRGHVRAEVWEAGHRHVWDCGCMAADHGRRKRQLRLF